MKRLIALLLLSLVNTVLAASVFDHPTNNNSAQLIAISTELNRDKILRGNFTQTKHIAILQRPLISSGSMLRVKKRGVLWEVKQPISVRYLITDQGIEPLGSSNMMPAGGFNQNLGEIFSALVTGNIKILANHFALYFLAGSKNTTAPEQAWTIGLKPLPDSIMAQAIASIVLTGDQHISSITIAEKNADQTRLDFSNLSTTPNTLSKQEASYFAD